MDKDELLFHLVHEKVVQSYAQMQSIREWCLASAQALVAYDAEMSGKERTVESVQREARDAAQKLATMLEEWTRTTNVRNAAVYLLCAATIKDMLRLVEYDGQGPCPVCGQEHPPTTSPRSKE